MGGLCSKKGAAVESKKEDEKELRLDNRKRNSLVFAVTDWVGTDFGKDAESLAILLSKRTKESSSSGGNDPRGSRAAKTAESIALGNFRELREIIIGHFAQVNKRYGAWDNDTLLHIVCREGYLRMVEFMVDPKNVSQFDTAPETTSETDAFDTTEIDFNAENNKWRTPLHVVFTPPQETYCARKIGVHDDGLPKGEKPEGVTIDSDWIRPGTERHRMQVIELLIDKGANIHQMDYHDHSPLHYACVWGWVDTVELLLEKGADPRADPETSNIAGQNALMAATEFKHVDVVDLLLSETQISIESKNVDGETALIYGALTGDVETVECLCEFGANVNAESYSKDSPLKRACRNQDVPMIHKLLDFAATRRPSAFELLEGDAKQVILDRLEAERLEKLAEFEAIKNAKASGKKGGGRGAKASAVGEWRPYRDKRGRGIFYYNRVSRVSQFEVPEDYEKDRSYIMKDATFGMHFYH
ncbi:hypothetical protein JL722_887 [Aureococcus anophagefferens]|nr:hypothetical protein JL722_887 [Aureococcus anophagefferens]